MTGIWSQGETKVLTEYFFWQKLNSDDCLVEAKTQVGWIYY